MTAKQTKTAKVLQEMLTENTGRHFLDSGDYYGRNWERNQGRDFESAPLGSLEIRPWKEDRADITVTLNVYHWLKERVTYNGAMNKLFQQFAKRKENEKEAWLPLMEMFVQEYLPSLGVKVAGLYGEGDAFTNNTYNGEDALSQVLQYVYFTVEDKTRNLNGNFVLLQIHGGADVRGGYTMPRAFEVEESIFDNARYSVSCEGKDGEHHTWDCDGGSSLDYVDGRDDETDAYYRLNETPTYEAGNDAGVTEWRKGIVWIDEDGTAHCPACGSKLDAYPL